MVPHYQTGAGRQWTGLSVQYILVGLLKHSTVGTQRLAPSPWLADERLAFP